MGRNAKDRPCIVCGKEIESSKQDYSKYCKKCYKIRDKKRIKAWQKNNPERVKEIRRKYRKKLKEAKKKN